MYCETVKSLQTDLPHHFFCLFNQPFLSTKSTNNTKQPPSPKESPLTSSTWKSRMFKMKCVPAATRKAWPPPAMGSSSSCTAVRRIIGPTLAAWRNMGPKDTKEFLDQSWQSKRRWQKDVWSLMACFSIHGICFYMFRHFRGHGEMVLSVDHLPSTKQSNRQCLCVHPKTPSHLSPGHRFQSHGLL